MNDDIYILDISADIYNTILAMGEYNINILIDNKYF